MSGRRIGIICTAVGILLVGAVGIYLMARTHDEDGSERTSHRVVEVRRLEYRVQSDVVIGKQTREFARDIQTRLKEIDPSLRPFLAPLGSPVEGFDFSGSYSDYNVLVMQPDDETIVLLFADVDRSAMVDREFLSRYPLSADVDFRDQGRITLRLDADYIEQTRQRGVERAMEIVQQRLDLSGLEAPSIARRGEEDIVVILPCDRADECAQIKLIIEQIAELTFKIVPEYREVVAWHRQQAERLPVDGSIEYVREGNHPYLKAHDTEPLGEDGARAIGKDMLAAFVSGHVPAGYDVGFEEVMVRDPGNHIVGRYWRTWYLFDEVLLSGSDVLEASVAVDSRTNMPYISLIFTAEGAQKFAEVTTRYQHEYLAIMLDDVVKSAPVINEPITGGRAQITLGRVMDEQSIFEQANNLVIVLQSGAMPAPLDLVSDTITKP